MSIISAIVLWGSSWIAVSAIARTAVAARHGPFLVVPLLPLPWFVRAPYPVRIVLAFAIAYLFLGAVDFAAGKRPVTFAGRLWYVMAFGALIDSMTLVSVHRYFDRDSARRIAIAVCAAGLGVVGWIAASALPAILRIPTRLTAAAALILVAAELNNSIVGLVSAAFSVRFAVVHADPYRSHTISEFWSRRWNRLGARWFRQHVFLPLRARSVAVALFTLFGLSAAIHVYLIASVVPAKWMAMWAAFFLSQPLLIMAERRMRVQRWPPYAARVWTFTILIALLPLALTPLIAALGLAL